MRNPQKSLKPAAQNCDSSAIGKIVEKIAHEILAEFANKQLKENELAISLVDLTERVDSIDPYNEGSRTGNLRGRGGGSSGKPEWHHSDAIAAAVPVFSIANFRGEEAIFPASVVKLFYLVAVQQWLQDKKITETEELARACKDMIVESSNDAAHYIVDVLTDTTGGPELLPHEMAVWTEKRNVVNKYFHSLGYKNINVNQKTWSDGPYGRERIFYGDDFANRNKLTTNATARLLAEIATGKCVNKERSKIMLDLLARDFNKSSNDPDDQATGFFGSELPAGARLWSKAGWMSTARHDAAYIELPGGIKFVLVAFVSNHAKEYAILPAIAAKVVQALAPS